MDVFMRVFQVLIWGGFVLFLTWPGVGVVLDVMKIPDLRGPLWAGMT